MGFEEEQATIALRACNDDVDAALTYILDGQCEVIPSTQPRDAPDAGDSSGGSDDCRDTSGAMDLSGGAPGDGTGETLDDDYECGAAAEDGVGGDPALVADLPDAAPVSQRELMRREEEKRRELLRQLALQLRARRVYLEVAELAGAVDALLEMLPPRPAGAASEGYDSIAADVALPPTASEGATTTADGGGEGQGERESEGLAFAQECTPTLCAMLASGALLPAHTPSWTALCDLWRRAGGVRRENAQRRHWSALVQNLVRLCFRLVTAHGAMWALEPLQQMLNGQTSGFFTHQPASYVAASGRRVVPPNEGAVELHLIAVNEFSANCGVRVFASMVRGAAHTPNPEPTPAPMQEAPSGVETVPGDAADAAPRASSADEEGRSLSFADCKMVLSTLHRVHPHNTAAEWKCATRALLRLADRVDAMTPDSLLEARGALRGCLGHMLQLKNALLALDEEQAETNQTSATAAFAAAVGGSPRRGCPPGADSSQSDDDRAPLAEDGDDSDLDDDRMRGDGGARLSRHDAARLGSKLSLRIGVVWPHAALRCFNSPKLLSRRLGAELLGIIAKYLKQGKMEFSVVVPRATGAGGEAGAGREGAGHGGPMGAREQQGTRMCMWLSRSGVWERLLGEETLDDRVVDEVEGAALLPYLPHTQASVEELQQLALPRLGRASVQHLLVSWLLHRDFPKNMLLHFAQRLTARIRAGSGSADDFARVGEGEGEEQAWYLLRRFDMLLSPTPAEQDAKGSNEGIESEQGKDQSIAAMMAASELGPQAYHLFVSLFVHVNGGGDEDAAHSAGVSTGVNAGVGGEGADSGNTRVEFLNMHGKRVIGSMLNAGGAAMDPLDDKPFGSQNRPPPQSLSGAKMVGQWVKIKQDIAATEFRDGELISYNAQCGKYVVRYVGGCVHEKSLHSLHEWYLLPPQEEQLPISFRVKRVRVEPKALVGMKSLWALALRSHHTAVAAGASRLLLSLYEKMAAAAAAVADAAAAVASLELSSPDAEAVGLARLQREQQQVQPDRRAEEKEEQLRAKADFSARWSALMPGDMVDVQVQREDGEDRVKFRWMAAEVAACQDAKGHWYRGDATDGEQLYEWSSLVDIERKQVWAERPVADCRGGLLAPVFEQLQRALSRAAAPMVRTEPPVMPPKEMAPTLIESVAESFAQGDVVERELEGQWFPAYVTNANADGSYDLNYTDDGNTELVVEYLKKGGTKYKAVVTPLAPAAPLAAATTVSATAIDLASLESEYNSTTRVGRSGAQPPLRVELLPAGARRRALQTAIAQLLLASADTHCEALDRGENALLGGIEGVAGASTGAEVKVEELPLMALLCREALVYAREASWAAHSLVPQRESEGTGMAFGVRLAARAHAGGGGSSDGGDDGAGSDDVVQWLDSDYEDDLGGDREAGSVAGAGPRPGRFALRAIGVLWRVVRSADLASRVADGRAEAVRRRERRQHRRSPQREPPRLPETCVRLRRWIATHTGEWVWALAWLARAASPLSQRPYDDVCNTAGRRAHARLRRMVSGLGDELATGLVRAAQSLPLPPAPDEPGADDAGTEDDSTPLSGTAADEARGYALVVRGAGAAGRDGVHVGGDVNGLYEFDSYFRGRPCWKRRAPRSDGTTRCYWVLWQRSSALNDVRGRSATGGAGTGVAGALGAAAAWYICTRNPARDGGWGQMRAFYKRPGPLQRRL
eukprot:g700.t1